MPKNQQKKENWRNLASENDPFEILKVTKYFFFIFKYTSVL